MLAVGSSEKLVPKYQTTRRHYTNTTIQIFGVINILNLMTHCMCSFDEICKASRPSNFLNPESGYVSLDNGCSDLDPDREYLDPIGGCLDLVNGYL